MRFNGKAAAAVSAALFGAALALAPAAEAGEPAGVTAAYGLAPGEAVGFGTGGAPGTMAYSDCPSGWICFFSGPNGTGSMCRWNDNDAQARGDCSWMAGGTPTDSVYNRTNYRFHYYREYNYVNRIGSTVANDSGNLAGTYTIGSLCRHDHDGCPN